MLPRNSKLSVGEANKWFGGYWRAALFSTASQNYNGGDDFDSFLRLNEERLSMRRDLQKQVFNLLFKNLVEGESLVDLMSGEAQSTAPLIKAGAVDKLYLLDDGTTPETENVPRVLLQTDYANGRVEFIASSISGRISACLPEVPAITLIDTGLSLPEKYRYFANARPENISLDPRFSRVGHVNLKVDFGDVLDFLPSLPGRVLHVFDAPFYTHQTDVSVNRNFVQGFVDSRHEWEIVDWTLVEPDSPMTYGLLRQV